MSFKTLCTVEQNVELVFECHEGQAYVHLHHALGHQPQHLSQQNHANQELYNFTTKVLSLLQSGKNAKIVFESHDGLAKLVSPSIIH